MKPKLTLGLTPETVTKSHNNISDLECGPTTDSENNTTNSVTSKHTYTKKTAVPELSHGYSKYSKACNKKLVITRGRRKSSTLIKKIQIIM